MEKRRSVEASSLVRCGGGEKIEMDEQLSVIPNQKTTTDDHIEMYHEISCELCVENGFDECQGHAYDLDNDTFLD